MQFPELLQEINDLDGNFWIQFLSSHPKDMSDELIKKITSLPKVCEYVHLPIQAGDNEILRLMNRKYTREHYLGLIEKIKKGFEKNKPGKIFAITSDIIVGFPGETNEQFEKSGDVMNECEFDMVYFGQFSPRPETAAWKMKDNVSKQEKVRREKYLNEILKKTTHNNNKGYVGKVFDVLIEKERNGFYFGKTRTLKNVKMKANQKDLIGTVQKVKITKANIWSLAGELIYDE
jgi:tRNA-2-methylthio-N6-dimethylallyladenosine synthase